MAKQKTLITALFSLIFLLTNSGIVEARVGGGRSSTGYRGSRGFSAQPSSPSRSYYMPSSPRQPQPQTPPRYNNNGYTNNGANPYGTPNPSNAGGGSFMRGLLGGVAGGFLGSMLGRSFGYAGNGGIGGAGYGGGGGGFGFLEILLLIGLGYFLYRMFMKSRQSSESSISGNGSYDQPNYGNQNSDSTQYNSQYNSSYNNSYGAQDDRGSVTSIVPKSENEIAQDLKQYDPSFDLNRFKDARMDDFLKIQSAWNARDLTPVQNLLARPMVEALESDVNDLKQKRQINKLENIAVRGTELVEAWEEEGKEYATVNFRAQLLDYTVDESTSTVVAGDKNQPVKFDEEWTFVRDANNPYASTSPWRLTAIANK